MAIPRQSRGPRTAPGGVSNLALVARKATATASTTARAPIAARQPRPRAGRAEMQHCAPA